VQDHKLNLPILRNSQNYIGLYVVDFGDSAGVGFTGEEVSELLDSEKFKDIKVYKIHNAYPNGRIELKAIRAELFQLEMGMFFYSSDLTTATEEYKKLVKIAITNPPPSRAKVHLAKYSDVKYVVAVIYPAEYNDDFSSWLLDTDYETSGEAVGGISIVQQYYNDNPEILERHQLLGQSAWESRSGEELLMATRVAVQR
jgi:hypothetical protein